MIIAILGARGQRPDLRSADSDTSQLEVRLDYWFQLNYQSLIICDCGVLTLSCMCDLVTSSIITLHLMAHTLW